MKPETLPAAGGAYVRNSDGSLTRTEDPTTSEIGARSEPPPPVEEAVQHPVKRNSKEAS